MRFKKKLVKVISLLMSAAMLFTSADFTVFAQGRESSSQEAVLETAGTEAFYYALFAGD